MVAWAASEIKKLLIHARASLVVTPQHGKAFAFGLKVFPFVVQAEALGNSLQSESNRA